MIKVSSEQDKVWVAKVHEAGQDHVFDGWDSLSSKEQRGLLDQLREIDFQLLKRLIQQHIHGAGESHEERVAKPADLTRLSARNAQDLELARTLGDYALKNGEVGLVMAAGHGSTPDAEPFGLLPVGPVTGKSLFQLQAEKIQALNRHYRVSLHWFVFCHPDQLETISSFFRAHNYFGLNCSDLHFCAQELLPVVNRRGKLLLEAPGRVAMNPIVEGGILTQLFAEERLRTLERAGIKHLFFFHADNPLVKIADPSFVGMHIENQSDVSSKAICTARAGEDLPVFCTFNNSPGIIRPSELSVEDRDREADDGSRVFGASPIGAHLFSVDFLRRLQSDSTQASFTGVEQVTEYVGKRGRVQRPTEPNSIRFQISVFDALSHARRSRIVETRREDEFSPIRNASGAQSPETAQRDLSLLYARWLREASDDGIPAGAGQSETAVEISPLYALDAEELKDKIELPVHLEDGAILLGGKA